MEMSIARKSIFVCARTCQNHRPFLVFCHAFLLLGVGPLYMRKWLGTTVCHSPLTSDPTSSATVANLAFTTSSAGTTICSREIDIPERRCSHPSFYEWGRSKIRHTKSCTATSSDRSREALRISDINYFIRYQT